METVSLTCAALLQKRAWIVKLTLGNAYRVELALGWFGKLDSLDVAMLDLLSHGPSV